MLTSWELQNGFTERLSVHIHLKWDQMSRKYYAVKYEGKHSRMICHGTNLQQVRKEARFYV